MSAEFRAHLQARASRVGPRVFSGSDLEQIERYFQLLIQWNRRINLTALALDPPSDQAIDRLFIEPLVASTYVRESGRLWVDLGSGGGSPAVPMRLLNPAARLVMVEARIRKAAFLREVVRGLSLANVTVLAERFNLSSERPELAASTSLVTSRAVRPDSEFFDITRRLLEPGGQLLFFSSATAQPNPPSQLFEFVDTVELVRDKGSTTMLFDFRAL